MGKDKDIDQNDVSDLVKSCDTDLKRVQMIVRIKNTFSHTDNIVISVKCSLFYKHPKTESFYEQVHMQGDWSKTLASGEMIEFQARQGACVRSCNVAIIVMRDQRYIKTRNIRRMNVVKKCWTLIDYDCGPPL